MITRRAWIGGALAMAACGPQKGTGFPGFAIVASEGEHTLSALSLERFRVAHQLPLEAAPSEVMALSDPPLVLCLLPGRGTLIAVDNEAVAVRRRVRVGDESLGMRLDEDGKRVWILNKSPNTLVAVDLKSFRPGARVRLPGSAGSLDVFGKMAAVSLPDRGEIAIIENDRVSRTISTGTAPEMICFRPDGGVVIAGDPHGQMLAIADPATGRMLVKLPLPMKPRRFCYNFDGGQLFITGEGMDAVTIVSPYQTEVGETILAGHSPGGMAVPLGNRPDRPDYLFVTNSDSGDVTVIDIYSRHVMARIPVGQDPQEVVITPDNQYALVLNRKSGDIAVIRVPSIDAWGNAFGNHRSKTAPLFTMVPVGARPVSAAISRT
jgi:YVTN family beta-propeller protein